MGLSGIFNRKVVAGIAAAFLITAVPTWNSHQHDQKLNAQFMSAMQQDQNPRIVTIKTNGVTRQGFVNRGAALNRWYPRSNAFLLAQSPQAACWYTTLRVTDGQEKLPLWQKIFGGAEWEWFFASAQFGIINSRCAPVAGEKTVESVRLQQPKF